MSFLSSLYSLSLCAVTLPHFQSLRSGGPWVPRPPPDPRIPPASNPGGCKDGAPSLSHTTLRGSSDQGGGRWRVLAIGEPPGDVPGVVRDQPSALLTRTSVESWAAASRGMLALGIPASCVAVLFPIRRYRLGILMEGIYIFLFNET